MKTWIIVLGLINASLAMGSYVTHDGNGPVTDAGSWSGGALPTGSVTGLVSSTVNVWPGGNWENINVRQTGGLIAGGGNALNLYTGAMYEIEDSRTNYAAYTNLYLTGAVTIWSSSPGLNVLSQLSGHVDIGMLDLLAFNTINFRDGIFHVTVCDKVIGDINFLSGGTGEMTWDYFAPGALGNVNFDLNFASDSQCSITYLDKDATVTGNLWTFLINQGRVSIDGAVSTDPSKFTITDEGASGSRLSLSVANELTPVERYSAWAVGCGLSDADGTAALTADPDGDHFNNLTEYALGGNPADPADKGHVPTWSIEAEGGTNYLVYVHFERDNKKALGLNYFVEQTLDLAHPSWTTNGISTL